MALSIKHPEADRLARELASRTGESLTDAIINALRERLRREQGRPRSPRLRDEIHAIRRRCAALPVKDRRGDDEIVGRDLEGIPR
jgi:antitoxin VapB